MRVRAPDTINELEKRNISTDCPNCRDTVALIPQHNPITDSLNEHSYFVALCPNHKKRHCNPIFAVYEALNDIIDERYPIPSFSASNMHEAIPKSIREDYAEARRCMYVDANKGAVALFRRVVEAIACDKLGDESLNTKGKTKKLDTLIDLLFSRGIITKNIKDNANEIRLFGNYGAHVQDDGLDKVDRDEAQDVREISWQLLHTIYVAPFTAKNLRDKRLEKGST